MNPPPPLDSQSLDAGPPETLEMPSALLVSKIRELRGRILAVGALCGTFKVLTISGVLLAAAMGCDWWFELPYGARLVLLFLHLAVFVGGLFLFIIRSLLHRPDEDELALRIEASHPEMAGRFIAAVQLTRPSLRQPGDSASLIRATVGEAESAAKRVNPREMVSTREMKRLAGLSLLLLLPLVLAFILQPGISSILLHRVALKNIPVPRKTIAIALTGNKTIGRGDDLMIEAEAKGLVPAQGRLMINYQSRGVDYPLDRVKGTSRFQRKLENVQESFNYKLRINDGSTATYSVKVLARPVVTFLDCVQEFPAYTQLPPLRRPSGDLSLLAGSRIHLKMIASQPVKKGWVRLIGLNTNLNLQFNPGVTNGLSVTFAVPSSGLNGFSLHLLDEQGMETLDPVIYPVEIIPDKPPTVVLTAPERKEELVTRNSRVSVGLQISDDYAIAKARLCYKVVGDNQPIEKVELDLGKTKLQSLRRRHEWKISTAAPKISEGTLFEYWIEAMDNNNVTGPGLGESEHQFARVVSDSEKRADLLSRAGDYLGTIGDVTVDQEKANKNLGEVILEKTSTREN